MRRGLVAFFVVFLLSFEALAIWIWTPETRKWINPKGKPKESAAIQYRYAEKFFAEGDYEKAEEEYKRLLKYFPDSSFADLAQFSLGKVYQTKKQYSRAFEEYQKIIDNYPQSDLYNVVISKEKELADLLYLKGKSEESIGFFKGRKMATAIKIYKKVVENKPFSDLGCEAQYRVGLCYFDKGDYEDAAFEYQKLIEEYPSSKWVEEAAFGKALCKMELALPAPYDQTTIEDAIRDFEDFLRLYPQSEMAQEAKENIEELKDRIARQKYLIALFYKENFKFDSAKVYLSSIVDQFPQSPWALKAKEMLALLP